MGIIQILYMLDIFWHRSIACKLAAFCRSSEEHHRRQQKFDLNSFYARSSFSSSDKLSSWETIWQPSELFLLAIRQAAPVPWPITVTDPLSPPKSWMFSWIQWRAAIWSKIPRLLGIPLELPLLTFRNPESDVVVKKSAILVQNHNVIIYESSLYHYSLHLPKTPNL